MRNFSRLMPLFIFWLNSTSAQTTVVKDEPIRINRMNISVKANCFSATTILEIELFNPNPKILDGEYDFSLNEGQVVSGFALDINGRMREGVIVDKQKGRIAYENTIRQRVDPGLLEMIAPNNYRVRVYPMPANGSRKISVTISELLEIRKNSLNYNLPINLPYKTKEFRAEISTACSQQKPVAKFGLLKGKQFQAECDSFHLFYADENVDQLQNLSFTIPLPASNPMICSKKINDTTFFIVRVKPEVKKALLPEIKTATIFWDISSSSTKRNLTNELKFLQAFCEEKKISDLTVVTFSHKIHETKNFSVSTTELSQLEKFLKSQVNDGATQLGVIDCGNYQSDAFLLFSDGLSNFGSDKINPGSKPVYCVSSSVAANQSLLKNIAQKSDARYFNLNILPAADAIKLSNELQAKLISVNSPGQLTVTQELPQQFDDWITISGFIKGSNEILLRVGDQGQVTTEFPVILNDQNCTNDHDNLLTLQVYQSFNENGADATDFCKKTGLVSESTSLIVLDNLSDYIDYGIEPPNELREEYDKQIYIVQKKLEDLKQQQINAYINNLKSSADLYNERIRWWDKNENRIDVAKIVSSNEQKTKVQNKTVTKPGEPEKKIQNTTTQTVTNQTVNALELRSNSMSEVVITTALGIRRRPKEIGYANTTLKSESITPAGYVNLGSALSGKVAGLTVYNTNQAVNSIPKIVLRGYRSITGNNEPLIVINNSPVPNEFLSLVNTNDIESVTVLKGGQASALYGSEGANGVIIVTLKTGRDWYGSSYTQPRRPANSTRDSTIEVAKSAVRNPEKAEYVQQMIRAGKDAYKLYLELKDSLGINASFYFNSADALKIVGRKDEALRVLSNLAELDNENHQLLRAMAYTLESWEMFDEAILVYSKVLSIKEEEPQSYRDLALAYEKKGNHQLAVEFLYACLTKNWFQYENRYRGLRGILLTEMNAIIERHRNELDLSNINEALIKPLPVDLRIVIDWNKDETDIDLHIIDPSGEECYYSHKETKAGGRLSDDFTQGYGPEEFQLKDAKPGKYKIRINYYGDRYQKQQTPSIVKLTIFKNFGKPNQTETTQSFVMDKQSGMIEIGEVTY